MFFWTEHKQPHFLFGKFIRQQQFSFYLLHFWGHFLGAHNVWTLSFSVWIRPYIDLDISNTPSVLKKSRGSRKHLSYIGLHWLPQKVMYLKKTVRRVSCIFFRRIYVNFKSVYIFSSVCHWKIWWVHTE